MQPAGAALSVTPRISAGAGYTDNVFLEPDDPKYDYVTFVAPGIDVEATGRNNALKIAYDPAYLNFSRFPERTYWRHSMNLDGWAEIARSSRLEVTDRLLYTEDPGSDLDTTVRQGREPYFTNTATVGLVNRFGDEDQIALRYTHYLLDNEDPTIEDSAYHQPGLETTYWFVPNRYAVDVEARYTVSEFDVSENLEDLDARLRLTKRFSRHLDAYIEYGHVITDFYYDGEDYQVYSPQVGFTWDEGVDTRFGASFGYFHRDNDVSEDDDGIVGSLDMAYTWATGRSLAVNGDVGYERAYFRAENLGFNPYYQVGGTLEYAFDRRLSGRLGGGYRRNLYIDEEPDREDAVWRAEAGLAYRALPWMTVTVEYRYRQVNSTVDANDYTENAGILSVTLTPRQAIRF